VRAIAPLTPAQLAWRFAPHLRSAGELARHIGFARLDWFERMNAPASAGLASQRAAWQSKQTLIANPAELVSWLEATWQMIEDTLTQWSVADLAEVSLHPFQGQTYALSRQWMIWHVLAHDLHHGGELALTLGIQGIALPGLGEEGGHLAERAPLAQPSSAITRLPPS